MDQREDPATALTATLALQDLRLALRPRAEGQVRRALQVAVLMLAGYRHGETRARLGLSAAEYKDARAWLREALAADRSPSGSSRIIGRS
jgi:hypothetical protein